MEFNCVSGCKIGAIYSKISERQNPSGKNLEAGVVFPPPAGVSSGTTETADRCGRTRRGRSFLLGCAVLTKCQINPVRSRYSGAVPGGFARRRFSERSVFSIGRILPGVWRYFDMLDGCLEKVCRNLHGKKNILSTCSSRCETGGRK